MLVTILSINFIITMNLENFNVEEGKEYIYLVMVEYKDKTLLKIGYTKTIDGRMDTYELHNPDIQLLKIREGSRDLEGYMHKRFEKYSYPKREEWFYYNEEIVNGFDTFEEINFLDIDDLKNKISKFLKPKPIEELKRAYYEVYKDVTKEENVNQKDLDHIITNTLFYINTKIEDFVDSLDYSEIPLELDPSIHYNLIIPNPLSLLNISINLERIIKYPSLKENSWKNTKTIYLRVRHKTVQEDFNELLNNKIKSTERLLKVFSETEDDNKQTLIKKYKRDIESSHYWYDYIAIDKNTKNEFIPIFYDLIITLERRVFEIQQMDYNAR